MNAKREEARRAAVKAETQVAADAEARATDAEVRSMALAQEHARDVMACLRELGARPADARRALDFCMTLTDVTLEERVRAALKFLCPKTRSHGRVGASPAART